MRTVGLGACGFVPVVLPVRVVKATRLSIIRSRVCVYICVRKDVIPKVSYIYFFEAVSPMPFYSDKLKGYAML